MPCLWQKSNKIGTSNLPGVFEDYFPFFLFGEPPAETRNRRVSSLIEDETDLGCIGFRELDGYEVEASASNLAIALSPVLSLAICSEMSWWSCSR